MKKLKLDQGGFTLLEILLTLAILAIICILTLPYFQRLIANYKLFATTCQVAADIRLAQQMAINEETEFELRFDLYALPYPGYRLLKTQGGEMYKKVQLSSDWFGRLVTTNLPNHVLRFKANGSPNQNYYGTIMLQNSFGRVYYVIVNPITGRVITSALPP